ncbi:hypothetical protein [Kribbella sp. VKM Ac-2569]|uniref:hypothetical protein n=1 Tax=Kribbella sp. VKM Ac-2569 TaxID=2512220 RepID=UPI0013004D8F|nr:hypothetical protein [Kribbella sp. VKM Ac-2569]
MGWPRASVVGLALDVPLNAGVNTFAYTDRTWYAGSTSAYQARTDRVTTPAYGR